MEKITVENCIPILTNLTKTQPLTNDRLEQAMAWRVVRHLCYQLGMSPVSEETEIQRVVKFITENAKK